MTEPKIGSKPAPPAEDVVRAQNGKRDKELTVGLFYAACKSAGADFVTFRKCAGGDEIVIKGKIGSKICEASLGVREGYPFEVHAMACLESFRQGRADNATTLERAAAKMDPGSAPDPFVDAAERVALGLPPIAMGVRKASATAGTRPKPPTTTDAKTGRRITATGFPECLRDGCPQPIAFPGGEFCGGECAKRHHTELAAKRQGVKLP